MLKGKKLLIFDCDGVLISSTPANTAYFNHCLTLAGHPALAEQYSDKVAYMSLEQLIFEIFGDTEEGRRVFNLSKTVPYDPFLDMIEVKFDFNEVLGRLRKNYFLAVASNRGKSLVTLFRHLHLYDYFHYKISARDAEPKPSPDMITRCMWYFGVSAKETIFFGDAVSDREAAQSADVDYCWVGPADEGPSIASVTELLSYLE
ncbi:MAG TPA: HAD family hydrolase [Spirochaetota bacterium]|nr:HAD family hydrolase [Spirochaetota bacterium]HPR49198.1 HAD family hydrolase [Spirochaetota bacterium]